MFEDEAPLLNRIFTKEFVRDLLTRRIYLILLVFAVQPLLFLAIANQPLSASQLQTYSTTLGNTGISLGSASPPLQVLLIFLNNAEIALQSVTPVYGQAVFLLTSYNTSKAIAVLAYQQGKSPTDLIVFLYLLPHTWIETSAYAVSTSEGLYLVWAIFGGGRKSFSMNRVERELMNVAVVLTIAAAILVVAAVFEVSEIYVGAPLDYLFWIPFVVLAGLVVSLVRSKVLVGEPSAVPASNP